MLFVHTCLVCYTFLNALKQIISQFVVLPDSSPFANIKLKNDGRKQLEIQVNFLIILPCDISWSMLLYLLVNIVQENKELASLLTHNGGRI